MKDTARFNDLDWRTGHEDYFSHRLDPVRLESDPVYAAGADYAAADDDQYQDDLALLGEDENLE